MLNRRELIALAATSFGATVAMSSAEILAAADPAMSLNVVYLNHDGAKFDTSYYRSTHIPLAMKVMAATSVMLIEGVPNGASPAPIAMIAHFEFASSEALQKALANPAMAEVRADVPRFTDIRPTVMIGKTTER
jgi:uncharacterized protein (TIGR02118 family)